MTRLEDVLQIPLRARLLRAGTAALIVIGDAGDAWAAQQEGWSITDWQDLRALFGLPLFAANHPILIRSATAERGLEMSTLALFGWIEDNGIREPRAEIFGITPFGEEPVLFLRDFDLDRPPQVCVMSSTGGAHELLLAGGLLLVDPAHSGPPEIVAPDDAALIGLESQLPPDTRGFGELLRAECANGRGLRAALKKLRREVMPELMALADGWRILSLAMVCARVGSAPTPPSALPQLEPPPAPRAPMPKRGAART